MAWARIHDFKVNALPLSASKLQKPQLLLDILQEITNRHRLDSFLHSNVCCSNEWIIVLICVLVFVFLAIGIGVGVALCCCLGCGPCKKDRVGLCGDHGGTKKTKQAKKKKKRSKSRSLSVSNRSRGAKKSKKDKSKSSKCSFLCNEKLSLWARDQIGFLMNISSALFFLSSFFSITKFKNLRIVKTSFFCHKFEKKDGN